MRVFVLFCFNLFCFAIERRLKAQIIPHQAGDPGEKLNCDLGTCTEFFYPHTLPENLEGLPFKIQHSFIPAGKGPSRMGQSALLQQGMMA